MVLPPAPDPSALRAFSCALRTERALASRRRRQHQAGPCGGRTAARSGPPGFGTSHAQERPFGKRQCPRVRAA
ncbi:hypothetical protein FA09DRAFT_329306 [Tilletiopsis washingtonensis]|uniref:Uncharacterized protein n=1 Tax=Tilletiopsis washingtonensis TaxID=58919 RepID=A0A316ZB49_9BASI|nr:hypothetical protein FA09DRAFT_329306 [Tilletiopsis washingtonensis]PWN98811.1 hypothetical protein FA09DRAFT_329306 [Tilletiopsis washingtonensis]